MEVEENLVSSFTLMKIIEREIEIVGGDSTLCTLVHNKNRGDERISK
jgi:hypothetical protein